MAVEATLVPRAPWCWRWRSYLPDTVCLLLGIEADAKLTIEKIAFLYSERDCSHPSERSGRLRIGSNHGWLLSSARSYIALAIIITAL